MSKTSDLIRKMKKLREDSEVKINIQHESYESKILKVLQDKKDLSAKIKMDKKENVTKVKSKFLNHVYVAIMELGLDGNNEQTSLFMMNMYNHKYGIPKGQISRYAMLIEKQNALTTVSMHDGDYKKSFSNCLQANTYGRWVNDYKMMKTRKRNDYMFSTMIYPMIIELDESLLTWIIEYIYSNAELVGADLKNGRINYFDDGSSHGDHVQTAQLFKSWMYKDFQQLDRNKLVWEYWLRAAKEYGILLK